MVLRDPAQIMFEDAGYMSAFTVTVREMLVFRSGSALVSINEVDLRRARLVLGWVTVSGFVSRDDNIRYLTGHPGRLSLLPYVGGKMSTSQTAVMLCSWGVKANVAFWRY